MKLIASLAAIFSLCLLVIYLAIPFDRSTNTDQRIVKDPSGDFFDIVGFPLPTSAANIFASDDHGGFHGDGTFQLIAQISIGDIQQLLSGPAPWNTDWVEYSQLHEKAQGQVSRNLTARFAARERCCDTLEWHNGDILAIDPTNGTLTLISWDY